MCLYKGRDPIYGGFIVNVSIEYMKKSQIWAGFYVQGEIDAEELTHVGL